MNDWQLLQDYLNGGSEAAFRTLTERYVNLVYSAALRQVDDSQLAEEVSQSVFILLARKAGSLTQNIVLSGWLFRTTRFVAAHARRAEQRRQRREQEALQMQDPAAPHQPWPQIVPLLDEALDRLGEADRNALLLRYFEGKSLRETGVALGLKEDAARKRVDRAVERLRGFFEARGVKVSGGVLIAAVAAHGVEAAPATLAASVAASACTGGAAAQASLPILAREVLSAWRWTRIKWAGALAGLAAAGVLLVSVSNVQPGRQASASSGDLSRAPARTPAVAAGSPRDLSASTVQPSQAADQRLLRLRVVAKETGEAVINAPIAVNTVTGGQWKERYDLATDGTGTAEVPYPSDTGRLDAGILAWGWEARYVTWMPSRQDGIPPVWTLQVQRVTNSMGGWLRDGDGRPVVNAEITAAFEGTGDAANRETPRERFGFQVEAVVARSDAQGWWACAFSPRQNHGGFILKARHPDFRPTQIVHAASAGEGQEPESEPVRALWAGEWITRMDSGMSLRGLVLDERGRPIPNAVIAHEPFSTEALVLKANARGEFAIEKLNTGTYDLVASADGFAPEYREVLVEPDLGPIEIRLEAGARLRLRLVDEQGEAVPGVRVVLEQWGELRHKLKWESVSGPDGRIEWTSAPRRGELELAAVKGGWCYARNCRFKADGEEHVITLEREVEVYGYVTDAETALPVSDFKVFPGYGEGQYAWERLDTHRGTNGIFRIQFQEGRKPWRVRVEAEGYAPFVSEPLQSGYYGSLAVALRRSAPSTASANRSTIERQSP